MLDVGLDGNAGFAVGLLFCYRMEYFCLAGPHGGCVITLDTVPWPNPTIPESHGATSDIFRPSRQCPVQKSLPTIDVTGDLLAGW